MDNTHFFLGLELGKIVEVKNPPGKTPSSAIVYSGSHTVYDLAIDSKERIVFFDASFCLRTISLGASESEEICQGEFWGKFHLQDSGKQIRMFKDGTRFLFRKSDRVLLEFACDGPDVIPARGIRLEHSSIADFCYSADGKAVYIVTDSGSLHFRSKTLDKDFVIDSGRPKLNQLVTTLELPCQNAGDTLQ